MKLPWVSRARYESEVCHAETLWNNFRLIRRYRDRLKELLRLADDAADFWKDSYKSEYEAHEETKIREKGAREKWEEWRAKAVEFAARLRKEIEKTQARSSGPIVGTAWVSLPGEGLMREVRLTQGMLDALRETVGAGGLDKEASGNHTTARRG